MASATLSIIMSIKHCNQILIVLIVRLFGNSHGNKFKKTDSKSSCLKKVGNTELCKSNANEFRRIRVLLWQISPKHRRYFVENDISAKGVDISPSQMKVRRTIRSITITETKSLAKVRCGENSSLRISTVARRTFAKLCSYNVSKKMRSFPAIIRIEMWHHREKHKPTQVSKITSFALAGAECAACSKFYFY